MASHHHDWQVHALSDYDTFQLDDTEELGMGLSMLVPLDAHHKSNGAFRMVLYGGDNENVNIPAAAVFPNLPPPIADTFLSFPCSSARTLIPDETSREKF